MPIPVLVVDPDLLPPLPENGPRRCAVVPDIEVFAGCFGRSKSALLAGSGCALDATIDSVIGLRARHPLVPLVLVTTVSEAAALVRRMAPDAMVTAPTTTDALVTALDYVNELAVRERVARAIERRHHLDRSVVGAMAACCRLEKRVPSVSRMVAFSGLSDSTFRERWPSHSLRPEDFLHSLDVIRAGELWENGVLVKDMPTKLGISEKTLERRKARFSFEGHVAERVALELLRALQ